MYREDDLKRIESIHKKLSSIYEIIKRHGSITNSLADDIEAQPAILMLLIASAEQFNKLKKNDSTILNSAYIGELGHLNRKHLDSLCKNIF